ncbi:helix-turn-helix transcriptional regulator [Nostoc sp. TCL240-02]|uniref:helix-turn-helix domain-containing protein n=1 Tax=Nostoc sp. TCL240-02 TaxID=2572090 RepID=UPI00157F9A23|nr:helix-turn-helix transcriptional regulator [Nostoc sp. TCL240-02]QKQ75567.1 helix-turn-helix transcriptional regulator [Nostoc sp. TCL240-02]
MWMEIFEQAVMSDQFGERFREIVKRAMGDRSQTAFARELGVSSSTVQKWLAGNGFPSSDNLEKIAKSTGLSGVDALRNYLKGDMQSDSDARPMSPEEIFLLAKQLTKEQRKRLINLMLEDL